MKEKGFTLIELLAVIVILAIIALIAVPIVLNIIEDARKESDERSVELYASAVKNGIAAHQLNGGIVPPGTYELLENGKELKRIDGTETFKVDYDGDVVCTTTQIYADGNIYLEGCTVNGGEEMPPYGTKQGETSDEESGDDAPTQVYKPQYYSWSSGSINGALPTGATLKASDLGKTNYLAFDVELDEENNQKVTAAYACFTINGTEYCLKGGDEGAAYATNQAIMQEAFGESDCSFENDYSHCDADGLSATAHSNGSVSAFGGSAICAVSGDGDFECIEY